MLQKRLPVFLWTGFEDSAIIDRFIYDERAGRLKTGS
jgi:hypothetical protein